MSIVSSVFTLGHLQKDGRRYVQEVHTDHLAVEHRIEYLAAAEIDHEAILAEHAAALEIALRDGQALDNLQKDSITEWIFEHVTVNQMRIALRPAYQAATQLEACRLARFVNELTVAQIEAVFSVSNAVATAIKNRAGVMAQRYEDVLASAGE